MYYDESSIKRYLTKLECIKEQLVDSSIPTQTKKELVKLCQICHTMLEIYDKTTFQAEKNNERQQLPN